VRRREFVTRPPDDAKKAAILAAFGAVHLARQHRRLMHRFIRHWRARYLIPTRHGIKLDCFTELFVDAAFKHEAGIQLGNRPCETRTSEQPPDRGTQNKGTMLPPIARRSI
jgi:hypothetical protein